MPKPSVDLVLKVTADARDSIAEDIGRLSENWHSCESCGVYFLVGVYCEDCGIPFCDQDCALEAHESGAFSSYHKFVAEEDKP